MMRQASFSEKLAKRHRQKRMGGRARASLRRPWRSGKTGVCNHHVKWPMPFGRLATASMRGYYPLNIS
jgi:hypothetical protein